MTARFKFTISGYVKDSRTGEVLIGATISIPGGVEGTITNNYGFYSLTLRREVEELFCSYVGYRLMVIALKGRQPDPFILPWKRRWHA